MPNSAQPPLPQARILLADDDDPFREGFARLLRSEGYDCVCAAHGPQALELLKTASFDALISDIFMPGNVNLQLIADIPQVAAGLPVILLTGKPSLETAVKSVNLSVTAYLFKPPDLAELRKILDKSIETYRLCRRMTENRLRFERWTRDLLQIEKTMRSPETLGKVHLTAKYLQLMTHNMVSVLDELEHILPLLQGIGKSTETSHEPELIEVVKRAIAEIEQTRQNFKSKRLGRLRAELQTIVDRIQSS